MQPTSPSLLDRVVAAVSPRLGVERLRARRAYALIGGYESGRRERRATKRWRPFAGSADADTLPDLPDLRARSRDLRRNNAIAAGAIATNVTSVVGDGLRLKAQIDADVLGVAPERADEMEREHEREFALFCKTCDFTRVQQLADFSALVFGSSLESGDAFVFRRYRKDPGDIYGTKLQLIEADRVSNPDRRADSETITDGIETDADGVPIAYHVADRHPGGLGLRSAAIKWIRVKARSDRGLPLVLHLFDRTRPELTRGVPYLAPVIEYLKELGTYTTAEVAAAVMSGMAVAFAKTESDGSDPVVGETTNEDGSADQTLALNEAKLGTAAIINLAPNEDVSFPNMARPNPQFDAFLLAFMRQIGVALELPVEVLIKHFTASYSASRAALEIAWQFFRRRRGWLVRYFYQPVYEWMLTEAVASGRLDRPGFFDDELMRQAYCGAAWIGASRPSLDQSKDAAADREYLDMEVTTREEIRAERFGDRGDWEGVHAQAVKEKRMRVSDGTEAPPAAAATGQNGANAAAPAGSDLETRN